jgi:hypothetical protein
MMIPPQQQSDEIKRDLQATLAARRELGTEYDDHFINALVEKLTAQVRQEVANAPRMQQPSNKLARDQRTGVAICSLIFGIPIIAITLGAGGAFAPLYFLTAIGMIVLINVLAAR